MKIHPKYGRVLGEVCRFLKAQNLIPRGLNPKAAEIAQAIDRYEHQSEKYYSKGPARKRISEFHEGIEIPPKPAAVRSFLRPKVRPVNKAICPVGFYWSDDSQERLV